MLICCHNKQTNSFIPTTTIAHVNHRRPRQSLPLRHHCRQRPLPSPAINDRSPPPRHTRTKTAATWQCHVTRLRVKTTWQMCHVVQTVTTHTVVTVQVVDVSTPQPPFHNARLTPAAGHHAMISTQRRKWPRGPTTTNHQRPTTTPHQRHNRTRTKTTAHERRQTPANENEHPPMKTNAHE